MDINEAEEDKPNSQEYIKEELEEIDSITVRTIEYQSLPLQ